jgi:hypothetical protein
MLPWVSSLLGFPGVHLVRDSRRRLLSRAWRNSAPKGHARSHLRVSISIRLALPTAREPGKPEKATLLGFVRLTLPHARTKPLPGYVFTSRRVVPCGRPPTLSGSSPRSAGAAWDRQRRQTPLSLLHHFPLVTPHSHYKVTSRDIAILRISLSAPSPFDLDHSDVKSDFSFISEISSP